MNKATTAKNNAITALKLKIGQTVKWKSGAGGVMKTKTGKIVALVAAGKTVPTNKFPTLAKNAATPRKLTSYVVDVKGKHYFPRPTLLQKV